MFQGEQVEACSGCYQTEQEGGKSLRDHANSCEETQRRGGLRAVYEAARQVVSENDAVAPRPSSIHLWLGNLCNLKCRMCSPHFSSQIAADPLHSRWSTNGKGLARRVVLLPDYLAGVRYDGFHAAATQDGVIVRLIRPDEPAVISLSSTGDPLRGLEITGFKDGPQPCTLVVAINGERAIEQCITDAQWHVYAQFQPPIECRPDISIRLSVGNTQARVGIRELALTSAPAVGKAFPREFASRLVENPNWFESEDVVLKEIVASPESIRFINFAGGEPLVHERIADILNLFVERGLSHRIGLYFSTNGTVKSPIVSSLLKQFETVGLGVSVDGIGALQEYIRFPSKWNAVVNNMLQYRSEGIAFVSVHPTPQVYNVFGLLELVRFCDSHDFNFTLNNVLHYPRYLSFDMLPQPVIDEALAEWRRYRANECRPDMLKEVDSVVGALDRTRPADITELQRQFVDFTNEFDNARGQRLESACPRLYQRLREQGFDL